jgi:hypothetical protein
MTNTLGTFQGVSTELGSIAAYSYGTDGQLCSDCETMLQVPAAVGVSLSLYAQALYAMVGYPWLDPSATPGGAIYFYANPASGGTPVIASIPSGLLNGMAAVMTH